MKKCLVIINPSSGKADFHKFLNILTEKLNQQYFPVEIAYTKGKGDATQFAKDTTADIIVSVGGDGTVREVVNGMMQNENMATLGIVPAGTVNDLARSLDIPLDPNEAINILGQNSIQKIDVGSVNTSYFISLIALGGIPQAIHDVTSQAKNKWGRGAYFMNGVRYAFKQQSFPYKIQLDNQEFEGETSLLVISLRNSVAGMEKFFKDSKPNDGKLHIMFFPIFKLIKAGFFVAQILAGKIHQNPQINIFSFSEAKIEVPENSSINIDGEKEQGGSLVIKIFPKVLPVIVKK
ncbi:MULTISPECIES: diacylglycerol/lipid kinase family protein [unclassified Jeotgalibaca]|uniref:diacylglycerol/lipid kinase family protein n=1 Tax=unclassified Jeotgalibaca TaxID=2621505 RepID=UPI003FD1A08E